MSQLGQNSQIGVLSSRHLFFLILFSSGSFSIQTKHSHHGRGEGPFHQISLLGTYKISPNPCQVDNLRGTCMFVWECLKSEGSHLGMCVDGFMFGSCCSHNMTSYDPDINAVVPSVLSNPSIEKPIPSNPVTIIASTAIPPKYTTRPTTTTPRPSTIFIDPQTTTTTVEPEILEGEVTCGVPSLYPHQMRIVGGQEASFGLFPWIASVRRTSFFGFSSTHRCGGALLNQNWVATAGHCVDDLLTTQIRIRLGEWDFSGTSEKYPHVERSIIKKIVHPSYNFFTYENDLALLKLETPLKFSPHISPICLPENEDLLIGQNATVAGWGRLSENGQLPSRLQHVIVPIMSNSKCRELFLKSNRVEHIPEIFLCAGYEQGGQDSCQGDSGGPLQVKGIDGRYFLGGIISWGIGCAEKNMPGVCTRISKFTEWILAQVT